MSNPAADNSTSSLAASLAYFYATPSYTGPARLPNPPQPRCMFQSSGCHTDHAPNRINATVYKAVAGTGLAAWEVHERVR
jgi:hypothetical protein